MKLTTIIYGLVFLSATCGSILADATTKTETDKRLHSGGKGSGFQNDKSEPKKFNVLLIGDSVMGGYRGLVKGALQDTANCDTWKTPAHLKSAKLLEELRLMVSSEKYDVIHFNIGLHGWPEGRIPEGQYEPALRAYVETLKKESQGARLIWASTTPIMTAEAPRKLDPETNPVIVKRNKIAAKVMLEHKILINDLYAMTSQKLELGTDKFHWNAEGKRLEAKQVEKAITGILPSK